MKDYIFTSKVSMTPKSINLRNIYFAVDNTLIEGDVLLRPKVEKPLVRASLNIDRLNLDRYGFTKKIYKTSNDTYAKLAESNLLASPLRLLNARYEISLNVKDLIFNKRRINDLSSSLIISQGLIDVKDFAVRSKTNNFNMALLVDLMPEKPILNFSIDALKLDTSLIIPTKKIKTSSSDENIAIFTPTSTSSPKKRKVDPYGQRKNLTSEELTVSLVI